MCTPTRMKSLSPYTAGEWGGSCERVTGVGGVGHVRGLLEVGGAGHVRGLLEVGGVGHVRGLLEVGGVGHERVTGGGQSWVM